VAKRATSEAGGPIRVGVGGWTYEPWRGLFYPPGLPAKKELEFAGERLTAIEINGTFYRTQGPKSFAKWRDETPEHFVFSVKGHRAVVNAKKLAEAGEAVEWFFKSGLSELKQKLGPVLWQLAPFKKFDAEDLGAFLALLPRELDGLEVRHALEVRSKSFLVPEFIALAAKHNVAVVYADSDDYPPIADSTADFVYARLQRSVADETTGYSATDLDQWTKRAHIWAAGGVPDDLTKVASGEDAKKGKPRPVYVFFISGAKERNPAAAEAMIGRLKGEPSATPHDA
jgi:uncharacterized protein YecE (DUF72 family)